MAEVLRSLEIGVLGPGAIGSLLAALLFRAGYNATCLGREQTVEDIRRRGIPVRSELFGNFVAYPKAEHSPSSKLNILFVTVKSPALSVALKSVSVGVGENTVVVTLLNGIGHRERIRAAFGSRVVVGTIGSIEASLGEDGAVLHQSMMTPHIEIASDADIAPETLKHIAAMLSGVGFSAEIGISEDEVIWRKLARLSAIATLTSYSGMPVGTIRDNPQLRPLLLAVTDELCQVARTQNVQLSTEDVMRQIDALPSFLTTSMQRDVMAHKLSEVDSILGEPIQLAKKHGISVPMMQHCYEKIQRQISS